MEGGSKAPVMRLHCTNRRAAVFALAAVLLVSGRASGALAATTVLYVDNGSPSCSDTGVGAQTQPFCTIGAAAAVVTAGEKVQVASGTYPESVAIKKSGISGSPIVFTAAPGATVTLSGQTDGFTISGQAWVTVKGFTVTNTSSFGIYVSSSSHITISGQWANRNGDPPFGDDRLFGSGEHR
jgi:hypothetical protein